jgi:type IV secretion system protein VirB10
MADTQINIDTNGEEPKVTTRTTEPKGVQPKNAKLYLYMGAIAVLLLAAFFSSRTKPAPGAQAKDTPPQPVVQDTTESNALQLKQDIAQNKAAQQQDALNGSTQGTGPGHMMITGFDAAGKPIYGMPAGPGQPDLPYGQGTGGQPGQSAQPTAEQAAAQQLAAEESKRDDQARFSSNLAYTRSSEQSRVTQASDTEQNQPPAAQPPQSAYAALFQPTAAQPAAQQRSRDEIPATDYKRPVEVNLNNATGQPYVIYEGLSLDTILMNRTATRLVRSKSLSPILSTLTTTSTS